LKKITVIFSKLSQIIYIKLIISIINYLKLIYKLYLQIFAGYRVEFRNRNRNQSLGIAIAILCKTLELKISMETGNKNR